MSSFQGLSRGMICIAETTASAAGVLNKVGVVTAGAEPRMRPSWLRRSARASEGNRNKRNNKRRIIVEEKAAVIKPQGTAVYKPHTGNGRFEKRPPWPL